MPGERLLTQDELTEVLRRAGERAGSLEQPAQAPDGSFSVSDAESIAEELGIGPEHVRAVLRDRGLESAPRVRPGGVGRNVLLLGGVTLGIGLVLFGLGMGAGIPVAACGAVLLAVGWAVGTRKEGRPEQGLPVSGVCRVCGAVAYSERATFCEDHRYKGTGSGVRPST